MEAARTVKQCRHILKWTYVYGYYFDGTDGAKELFEMQQVSRCPDVFSPMFSWIQSAMGQTSHTVSPPPPFFLLCACRAISRRPRSG